MKKLVVASVAIAAVALSAPVRAADFPPYSVAKGPIIGGGFDWEGFYVGGHVGSATGNTSFTQTNVGWSDLPGGLCCGLGPPFSVTNVNTGEAGSLGSTSVTGGMQMGYNWLISGPFLVGIEADISAAGLSSTALTSAENGCPPLVPPLAHPLSCTAVASWTEKADLYGSVRARLGWVADNWLFYGTGGFGWDYDKFTRKQLTAPLDPNNAPFVDTNALQAGTVVSSTHFRPGWAAGAGGEWAFARTWTVKLEYLHYDTASETLDGGHFSLLGCFVKACPPPPNQISSSVSAAQSGLTIDTVRVGFNHTFN